MSEARRRPGEGFPFGEAAPRSGAEEVGREGCALPADLIRQPFRLTPSPGGEGYGEALAAADEVRILTEKVDSLAALVMAQNAVLERVAGILEAQTVTRTQERALKSAIRERAKEICEREGLKIIDWTRPAPERMMAEAIRKTLRELTGARAAADIPARMFDGALRHVNEWDYPGAIRRIRKEMGA